MSNNYKGPGTGTTDTYEPENLFAGDYPIVTDTVTIAEGQVLQLGTVLGKHTYDGEYVISAAAAEDGSERPYRVLAADVDASDGAVVALVYKTGMFNERALVLGAGHTIASVKDGLSDIGIHIAATVAAG